MSDIMLIAHFIGLTMGLGTSFARAFFDKLISNLEENEATRFRIQVMILSKIRNIGISLLIISGIYLIIPYWSILPSNPLLIVKLVLVLILVILLVLIHNGTQKAKENDAAKNLKKIEPLGKLTLLIGITIVIITVNIFH